MGKEAGGVEGEAVKPKPKSICALADETGADRRSIRKWLAEENVTTDDPRALEVIAKHRRNSVEENIDEATGLTWFQAKTREDTIKLRRENEIAEKLKDATFMETATVEKLVLMFINKLELVPVKIESEFSLDAKVVVRLRELLDEARKEMAKGILAK